ncbi:MAG: hypothetical protein LOX97_03665 [Sphingomonas sp.]|nr:hypothetical protein [Sphingomonas sp.]
MRLTIAVFVAALCAAPVQAAPKIDVQGLILGNEGARFVKGVPTLDLQQQRGAVQVRFLGWDHSNAVFAVGVFNAGPEPVNIGLENMHASAEGKPVRLFTVDELTKQAKRRATWSKIGLAFLGGLGAAAAASQRSHYSGTITSSYGGMYHYSGSYPSLYGQLQADRITANTTAGMAAIQYQLDATIGQIGDKVLQTTTVDPGTAFGGLAVVEKLDYGKAPIEFRLDVDWNGERYQFGYLLTRKGKAVPEQYAAMLAANARPRALVDREAEATALSRPSTVSEPRFVPAAAQPKSGAIALRSGAVKVPAQTPSGYCLQAPPGYVGTGSASAPVINKNLPRCLESQD